MRLCYDVFFVFVFFFKQKTAYEMRISDWSSDVCSSDLTACIEEAILDAGIPVAGQRRTNARNRLPGETRIRIVEERTGENRLDRDAGDTRTAADEALPAVVVAELEHAADHDAPSIDFTDQVGGCDERRPRTRSRLRKYGR